MDDVLHELRTTTAAEHERVETALDLLDPELTRDRLTGVLVRLHGFWAAAEAGLDRWAFEEPAAAAAIDWPRRRRTALFATDLRALGADPAGSPVARLGVLAGTDDALGRLYVLEGSTLGGTFIDRHLAGLSSLGPDVRVRAFSPYGRETGGMWHAFRHAVRRHVAGDGDAARLVAAARDTFAALADWCRPAPAPTPR